MAEEKGDRSPKGLGDQGSREEGPKKKVLSRKAKAAVVEDSKEGRRKNSVEFLGFKVGNILKLNFYFIIWSQI